MRVRTRRSLLIIVGAVLLLPIAAQGIEIAQPVKGSVVRPGTAMKIKLGNEAAVPVVRVSYYLIEQDRALEDRVEAPPTVTVDTAPFDAELMVPAEAIGMYRLLAVAEIQERRSFYRLFDEIPVQVTPLATVTALRAESPVRFTKTIGEVQWLTVRGLYSDRVERDLTAAANGTTYHLKDSSIVRLNGDGRIQALEPGRTEITAINQDKKDTIRVVVEVRDVENRPPIADAGPDQTVKQGQRVRLDAIRSADPEGENPFYIWSQVGGMPIDLLEPLSLRPYFKAPVVDGPKMLKFRLVVKDKDDAESFPAYVTVTVLP